jgi:hypothetical protein
VVVWPVNLVGEVAGMVQTAISGRVLELIRAGLVARLGLAHRGGAPPVAFSHVDFRE